MTSILDVRSFRAMERSYSKLEAVRVVHLNLNQHIIEKLTKRRLFQGLKKQRKLYASIPFSVKYGEAQENLPNFHN